MKLIPLFSALALGALLATPAAAHDYKAGTLVIHHPWARATPQGAPVGGGYAVIENTSDQPDKLTGGSFAASAGFAIHQMSMKDGVMSMAPVEGGLDIPAHGKVEFNPSATHLMFTGLKQQLKKGDEVDGTLVFEKAGTINVRFKVESLGAKAPEHDDH
ncbi:copper chaperone PCu(A)C [Labrys okinawensis]|uniref:copper chaperone PCu(A)C n=1 Tax=Labrys okinawensis TaxID=346911 RepID=UPI0039BCE04C